MGESDARQKIMRSTNFNSNKSGAQDVDGKEYIDFIGMFSAVNTGHCHPHIQRAVVEQLNKGMIDGSEICKCSFG